VKGSSFVETVGSSRLFGQMYSTVPITTSLSYFTEGHAPFAVQQLDAQNITPTASVRYVTVFQAGPSSTKTMASSEHIVSSNTIMEGAQIGNQVVLFGRNGPVASSATVTYTFNGSGAVQHLLVDLVPSQTYEVKIGGTVNLVSSSDQGTLTFSTPAGVRSVTVVADRLVLTSALTTTFTVGEKGTFKLTAAGYPAPSLAASGPLPAGVTFKDNGNGTATLTGTPAISTSGSYSFTITLHNGVVPDNSETFTLTVVVETPARFRISGAPASVAAGQSFNVSITVLDASNHIVAGFADTIQLATSDPQIPPVDITFSPTDNGTLIVPVMLETAGSRTITVRDTAHPAARGTSGSIKVTALSTVAGFTVRGFPLTDVVNVAHPVIVIAVDRYGNRVASYRGQVQLGVSGGTGSMPRPYTFTAGDGGAHIFSVTLTALGGNEMITAVDTSNSSLKGSEPGIDVVPSRRKAVALTADNGSDGLIGDFDVDDSWPTL
jgi:hypothetical protein